MKFLKLEDINFALSKHLIDQITCDRDEMLDLAEDRALTVVREWLSPLYDTDYELRAYSQYKPNVEYGPFDRVLIDTNDSGLTESIKAFSEERGIATIATGVTIPTIYVAKSNLCELSANTFYASKYEINATNEALQNTYDQSFNDSRYSFQVENPDYNETCGDILYSASTGTSLTWKTDKIKNYYSVEYVPNGEDPEFIESSCTFNQIYDVVPIDFEHQYEFSGKTPGDFLDNTDYFSQYLRVDLLNEWMVDDRNTSLIRVVSDIALYELLQRVAPDQLNETREDRYKQAMKDLKEARKGMISFELARKPLNTQKQSGHGLRWTNNWANDYLNDF
jgi:hypothetical protein